jgi:hypothetical protein
MSSDINQMIINRINESDEEEWVKDFAKKILSFERTQYTGKGGNFRDYYESAATESHPGDKE